MQEWLVAQHRMYPLLGGADDCPKPGRVDTSTSLDLKTIDCVIIIIARPGVLVVL